MVNGILKSKVERTDMKAENSKKSATGYMTLKVQLQFTEIARTITVPTCMTLEDLHDAIQVVMGWEDSHLWHFTDKKRDGIIYELPREDRYEFGFSRQLRIDASKFTLEKAFPARGSRLYYEYDFGDSWKHLITRMTDPKKPGIACVKTTGPDGIEDFGGQWRLADFIEKMKSDPNDKAYEDIREWAGLEDEKDLAQYLEGESEEIKTGKLQSRLSHVKIPEIMPDPMKMTEEEKASALGLLFAMFASSDMWKILSEAMANGGTCEFEDSEKEIGEFFLTNFAGLKVKDGRASLFYVEPSILTVLPEWVDLYKIYGERWNKLREAFDIFETYASSCASLYGVLSKEELLDIVMHYDPAFNKLESGNMSRMLECRAAHSSGLTFRLEGDLIVSEDKFLIELDETERQIQEVREEQTKYSRWLPETRNELFKWGYANYVERTAQSEKVRKMLRSMCSSDELADIALFVTHNFLSLAAKPEVVCKTLQIQELITVKGKNKSALIEAMDEWQTVIRMPFLNGNTIEELKATRTPVRNTSRVGRNDLCPCGSGKKYKKCCGR